MNIRRVKVNDTEGIVALWRDVFPEYNDPTRDHLARVPVLYASQCVINDKTDGARFPLGTSSRLSVPDGEVGDFARPASGPEPMRTDPLHAAEGGDGAETQSLADPSERVAGSDAVEATLANALAAAAAAGRFDIVAQLARELQARRQSVRALVDDVRQKRAAPCKSKFSPDERTSEATRRSKRAAFRGLADELASARQRGELLLVGGAALALLYNARSTTVLTDAAAHRAACNAISSGAT